MIKFLDLQKINLQYKNQLHQKSIEIIDKGWYVLGEEVLSFEKSFAHYNKDKFCVGVANGLDALILIFKGYIELGVLKKGDEVLVPANTYIASILGILHADLTPVFIEPSIDTYTLNPNEIVKHITIKTKAILAVHLYGQLADMEKIEMICKEHDLLLIEDCAQSHGINYNSNHTKAFSFYPSKNLGCLGDGGAICTNDESLDKVIRKLRNYGSEKKYQNENIGYNSRLDEIQAGFLNIKLPFLKQENERRQVIAKKYCFDIKNPLITLPTISDFDKHIFHVFVLRVSDRNKFKDYLEKNEIETVIHYPIPPHKQKALMTFNHLNLPITEKIHNEVISIPISPVLEDWEVLQIIKIINDYN